MRFDDVLNEDIALEIITEAQRINIKENLYEQEIIMRVFQTSLNFDSVQNSL